MAAAEMTETTYDVSPNLGTKILKFKFTGVTTADWVIFPNEDTQVQVHGSDHS